MNAHFVKRKLRIWKRWVMFSSLVAGSARSDKVKQQLLDVYKVVNEFLTKLEVDYFISFGTLLGYYREGGIIEGDEDIDFAAFVPDYEKIVAAQDRLPRGYKLYDTSADHNGPKLYVAGPKGWEADIYFCGEEGDQLRFTTIESYTAHMRPIATKTVLPLKQITFLDQPTWAPAETRAWLEYYYGYLGADSYYDGKSGLWRKKGTAS